MYNWMVFLHVIGIFLFLIAHGVSLSVSFHIRRERNLDRLRALAELSATTYPLTYLGLLVLLVSGIIAGFIGQWWGRGWIWLSLVLLIAMIVGMVFLGSNYFSRLRKAIGSPYREGNKIHPPGEPASMEEILALLAAGNPWALTAVGLGGFAIVTWLMMFKPF